MLQVPRVFMHCADFFTYGLLFPAAAGYAGTIRCLPESPCQGLFFQDVFIIDALGSYKCDPSGLVINSSFINCHPAPACIVDA
jgi:hypothetical protein